MNSSSAQYEQIADGLADRGYSVVDQFLSVEEVARILELEEFKTGLSAFKKSGVGKSISKEINESIRGDYIQWIDRDTNRPELKAYLNRLTELILYLNESLFLSLKDFEAHLTCYPAGSYYKRHLDQFKSDDHRRLSVILYLNEGWESEHGGQLRMHLTGGQSDFFPIAGRLICFRSDLVEHEVLPATRDRLSITGWMLDQLGGLRHL